MRKTALVIAFFEVLLTILHDSRLFLDDFPFYFWTISLFDNFGRVPFLTVSLKTTLRAHFSLDNGLDFVWTVV